MTTTSAPPPIPDEAAGSEDAAPESPPSEAGQQTESVPGLDDVPLDLSDPEPPEPAASEEAIPPKQPPEFLQTSSDGISVSRLQNGMTVIHSRTQKPAFRVRIRMNAGHIYDPLGFEGTAHLTLQQLYCGTQGMNHGSMESLHNWAKDRRLRLEEPKIGNYYVEFAGTCMAKHMTVLLNTMHALIFKPLFTPDIEQPQTVVREKRSEFRITLRSERLRRSMLLAHCDLHRLVTATGFPEEEVLLANTSDRVIEFHKNRYRTPNMTIAVAANMEHGELLDLLEKVFATTDWEKDDYSFSVVQPRSPIPNSYYSEVGAGKKVIRTETTLSWVISRKRIAVATLAQEILDRLLREKLTKSGTDLEISIAREAELDLFFIKARTTLEKSKAQLLKELITRFTESLTTPISVDKDRLVKALADAKEALEEEMYLEDGNATSTLEQALNDWYLYQKVLTPEERLKAYLEVTEASVKSFLKEDLKSDNCFCATVEQSE